MAATSKKSSSANQATAKTKLHHQLALNPVITSAPHVSTYILHAACKPYSSKLLPPPAFKVANSRPLASATIKWPKTDKERAIASASANCTSGFELLPAAAFLGRLDCRREADLGVATEDALLASLAGVLVLLLETGVLEADFLIVAGEGIAAAGSTDSLLVDFRAIFAS